jgi:hypothetical protein
MPAGSVGPWSTTLDDLTALGTIARLVPTPRPYHPGNADPDDSAGGVAVVVGLRCERDGTELGPIGISRTGACEICGLGRWVDPRSREAIDALLSAEGAVEGRRSRRGRR